MNFQLAIVIGTNCKPTFFLRLDCANYYATLAVIIMSLRSKHFQLYKNG